MLGFELFLSFILLFFTFTFHSSPLPPTRTDADIGSPFTFIIAQGFPQDGFLPQGLPPEVFIPGIVDLMSAIHLFVFSLFFFSFTFFYSIT